MSALTDSLQPVFSCAEIQALDLKTIQETKIPEEALMEEAAERVFSAMCQDYPEIIKMPVLLMAGTGNNGADTLCLARKLFFAGADIFLVIIGNDGSHLFNRHLTVCQNLKINTQIISPVPPKDFQPTFIIDGIFGIGYHNHPNRPFPITQEWRSFLIESGAIILAVDVPSGLTGCDNEIIAADTTYSIGYPKNIFYTPRNRPYCGRIRQLPISFNKAESHIHLATQYFFPILIQSNFVHKYNRGSCMILGGSPGKNGAPAYSATAAFSAGCGIVAVLTGKENFPGVACYQKEAVYDKIENIMQYEKRYSCTVIGPGLELNKAEKECVTDFLSRFQGQLVLDASFFTLFSPKDLTLCLRPPLLTPHSGEFQRFFHTSEISPETVCQTAQHYHCYILLKDSFIIFATPKGDAVIFDSPMRVAAQAGSGDILAGYLGGILQQMKNSVSIEDAVIYAVSRFYHELNSFTCKNYYIPEKLLKHLARSNIRNKKRISK